MIAKPTNDIDRPASGNTVVSPRAAAAVATTTTGDAVSAEPDTARELLTVFWFAIHQPNMAMETAKGVTATLLPILVRDLMNNMATSERNAASAAAGGGNGGEVGTADTTSDTFLGVLLAFIGVGTVVSNVPIGALIHRFSLMSVATAGGALYLFATTVLMLLLGSTAWYGYLQPFDASGDPIVIDRLYYRLFQGLLLASAFVWGVAFSCLSITRFLFVQHRVPKSYRSRLMSIVGGFMRWAMVVGPFFAGIVTEYFGIFSAFALHLPLAVLYSHSFYRSRKFREVSDNIASADAAGAAGGVIEGARPPTHSVAPTMLSEDARCSAAAGCDEVVGLECCAVAVLSDGVDLGGATMGLSWCDEEPRHDDGNRNSCSTIPLPASPHGLVVPSPPLTSPVPPPTSPSAVAASATTVAVADASSSVLPSFREAFAANWRIILVVGTFAFVMLFLRSSRNLMIAINALDLKLSASALGIILSVSYFIDATLFFLGGYLSDRFGSERIAVVATGALGLSFIALGIPVAPSSIVVDGAAGDGNGIPLSYYLTAPVLKLIIVSMLFGVANSIGSGLVLSLVANHAPASRGNAVLSLMGTVQEVGPLVGPLLAGLLMDRWGFDATCVLFGVAGLANGLMALLFMPRPSSKKGTV